jgi:plasmid maintenance system antidote protein VapI
VNEIIRNIEVTRNILAQLPAILPSPAVLLTAWLVTNKVSRSALARRMNLNVGIVSKMASGAAPVTALQADRLEKHTEIEARVWLLLQALHELSELRDVP